MSTAFGVVLSDLGWPATATDAAALPKTRIVRPDVVSAARALTIATPAR